MALVGIKRAALALLQNDKNLSGVEAVGAHVSGKPFRLDIRGRP